MATAVAADPHVLVCTGATGFDAGDAAAATAADPHEPGVGPLTIGEWTAVTSFELEPTLLNETGSDEIARGFANGMTLAGGGVAPPDNTDGSCAFEREPVGGGIELFGDLVGGGTLRTSTVVTSPASTPRGSFGITRNCVTGSCAILGRDFRLLIARGDALQNDYQRTR